jgi:signal transduction histidine kinase
MQQTLRQELEREFLSRMSHELRTPLSAILGLAQALSPKENESAGHILKEGRHLLKLIDEVLGLARSEADRLAVSPEPGPVRDIVREALGRVRPLAAEQHARRDDGERDASE